MEATGGGQLKIRSAVNNAGGLIEALGTNSDVQVADVTGGVIQASGQDAEVEIAGVIKSATLKADGVGAEFALDDGGTLTGSVSIQQGIEIEVVGAGTFDGRAPAFHTNMATVDVEGNSSLTLKGTIVNDGAITLNGVELEPGGSPQLPATMLIAGNVSLQGGGTITLRDDIDNIGNDHQGFNFIEGSGSGAVLRNFDNTIQGGGEIGAGDLTLINQAGGVIDATFGAPGSELTIDTAAHTIMNAGLMEATGGAELLINSALNNTGTVDAFGAGSMVHIAAAITNTGSLIADGGSLTVDGIVTGGGHATINNGGSLDFVAAANERVSFAGAGALLLGASAGFQGNVTGFAAGDTMDLGDIGMGMTTTLNFVSNMANSGGVLHVSDGANHADIAMVGSYTTSSFAFGDDNTGHVQVSLVASV
jgi:hypothetical protein